MPSTINLALYNEWLKIIEEVKIGNHLWIEPDSWVLVCCKKDTELNLFYLHLKEEGLIDYKVDGEEVLIMIKGGESFE
jgi:hypothetical protein